jgi:DNA-directed RNA polymerase subunit beta'
MRTFHIGGAATGSSEQSKQDCKSDGFAKYIAINTIRNARGELIAMNRNGILAIVDDKGAKKSAIQVYTARAS